MLLPFYSDQVPEIEWFFGRPVRHFPLCDLVSGVDGDGEEKREY